MAKALFFNKLFAGDYVNKGHIPGEIIDFLQADDGSFYAYNTPYGKLAKSKTKDDKARSSELTYLVLTENGKSNFHIHFVVELESLVDGHDPNVTYGGKNPNELIRATDLATDNVTFKGRKIYFAPAPISLQDLNPYSSIRDPSYVRFDDEDADLFSKCDNIIEEAIKYGRLKEYNLLKPEAKDPTWIDLFYNKTYKQLYNMNPPKMKQRMNQAFNQPSLSLNEDTPVPVPEPPKGHQEDHLSRNCIYFGAPGTGKSFTVDKTVANDDTAIRTTFHPDSDYASFVGAYKPTMNGDKIAYKFVPQAFTKAYVQAWEKMAQAEDGKAAVPQYLVIEEINRGNCAQIFGDLFQLLDRDDEGYSKYPIYPDADIKKHLYDWFHGKYTDEDGKKSQVNDADGAKWREKKASANSDSKATWADILSGSKLVLPPNLCIWATMNTSDQSLFPMDSAFKRRWEWKYSKIKNESQGYKIIDDKYDWWEFLQKINGIIRDVTSSADKQLGYFFVKLPDDLPEDQRIIDSETFVNKVIFYLWNDVFKDCELDDDAFMVNNNTEKDSGNNTNLKRQLTFDDFFYDNGEVNDGVVKVFLDELLKKNTKNNGAGETSPNHGEVPVSGSVLLDATTPVQ